MHCQNDRADPQNPSCELLQDVTFVGETVATLKFRFHQRLVAVFATSLTCCSDGYVLLKMADTSNALAIGILFGAGIPAIWALTSSQSVFSRPASPSYVLATMRSLQPDRRREFLARLNTITLRRQRIPFTQADVLEAVRECASDRAEGKAAKSARCSKTANMQSLLIAAFRRR